MSEKRVKIFFWGQEKERTKVKQVALKLRTDYTALIRDAHDIYMEYLRPVSAEAGEDRMIDPKKAEAALDALKKYAQALALYPDNTDVKRARGLIAGVLEPVSDSEQIKKKVRKVS